MGKENVKTKPKVDEELFELTEEERNNITELKEKANEINQKIFNLGILYLDIDKVRKQSCKLEDEADSLSKEITNLKGEFDMNDLIISNNLMQKYGKYELTEDLKIKKVGN